MSNAVTIGGAALAGVFLASVFDIEPETGAALGAAAELSHQQETNKWFMKSSRFTVTLGPHEERYETGSFAVSKHLESGPAVEILEVK